MRVTLLKQLLVGPPMPLAQARHERLSKTVALAVFASDPLSSVAYATEEILFVLVLAGSVALSYSLPIAIGIAALLAVVVTSYRQTVQAYPQGGGAYLVAKDNLGVFPALTAAAALLVDYVLTVSVSVVAGIAALTSAMPGLHPYRVILSVIVVALIALGNLRGVRESGRLFAAPTYFFVVSILGMVGYGLVAAMFDWLPEAPYEPHPPGLEGIGLFLLLRAYAAGCTALTGVEAVSNGVQALKPPEGRNAATVMTWLGVLSITMFLGITYLAYDFGIIPGGDETVVSKIARRVFGAGMPYYAVQAATMLILLLAANTSYADFPRLSSILARDRFVPRQFANQGDRLVFSNGILILSGFAVLLIVVFGGDTHALLPLYAIGVFISFTLSQGGMVRRWLRLREKGWRWRMWVNGVGAVVTGVVLLTLAVTKFSEGAWIVVVVVPILVVTFLVMHRHYDEVAAELSLEGLEGPPEFQHTVLVLIGDVHRGVVRAVQYARTLAPTAAVRAVYVETDPARTAKLEEKWARWGLGVPLVVLTSPYRSLLRPLLDYLDQIQARGDDQMVTIVLPEFLPRKWWQHLLHNQTALLVKGALLFRKNTVVADVPYLLKH
ncbi:MAG: amino acid permease [Candidatus Rokubacteria bacterium 13_1_40CM_4_69_5]|nr:MAG: amino acid permease [Candidatus Rokubacteria bacterium 13_1_40CM_4_69_5]